MYSETTSFSRLLCRVTWSRYFSFCDFIWAISLLPWPTRLRTPSLVICSVYEMRIDLRQHCIPKAWMDSQSSLFRVQASELYVTIGKTNACIRRAFNLLLTLGAFHGASSLILCLAMASRAFTFSSHDASGLNWAPRFLNDLNIRFSVQYSQTRLQLGIKWGMRIGVRIGSRLTQVDTENDR